MQGRTGEEQTLLDSNSHSLRRVFRRLKPDKEGRVAFLCLEQFFRSVRLCPVAFSQDFLSGLELKALCERTRTGNAQITMSFAQFEQLLIRISKRIKGEAGLRRVLEAVQTFNLQGNRQKLTLSYIFEDCRLEDQPTKRLSASRWSEKGLPRPSTLPDSMQTARSAGFSPLRQDKKPLFGTQNERISPNKVLERVGCLVAGLRKQQTAWPQAKTRCGRTQIRRFEEFVLRTRESHFSPAFVRRLVFGAWKKAVAS